MKSFMSPQGAKEITAKGDDALACFQGYPTRFCQSRQIRSSHGSTLLRSRSEANSESLVKKFDTNQTNP
jgi:hypothetical protein